MKKTIALGIVFLLVMMSFTSISGIQIDNKIIKSSDRGNILYVGGSGEGNYSSIQDAIDNASDGDTVFVYDDSSPYYEHIVITKSISLIGEDRDTTIIDGEGKGHVVHITVNGVTISGFTIQRSASWGSHHSGLRIESNDNLIKGNNIIRNGHGILLDGFNNNYIVSNNKIEYNNIELNVVGITLWNTCLNNIIYKNNINNNSYHGLAFDNMGGSPSLNNVISYNNINYNALSDSSGSGIWAKYTGYNQICYNNINYNEGGISYIMTNGLVIKCNNFIGNFVNAYFMGRLYQRWTRNYWNKPMYRPKIIFGLIFSMYPFILLPWINIDWFPAKEPYNYTTTQGCGIE